LLPIETLSSLPVTGTALATSSFGAAVACMALSGALLGLCRGAGWSGIAFLWLLSVACFSCSDLQLYATRGTGLINEVLTSIPIRLQLPPFAAGMIISSWTQPKPAIRVLGLALMVAYTFTWRLPVPSIVLQAGYRGVFLPAQALMVWSVIDLLAVPLPGSIAHMAATSPSPSGAVLTTSFASLFVLPMFAELGKVVPNGRVAVIIVCTICHLVEWAAWVAFDFSPRSVDGQAFLQPDHVFLGRFSTDDSLMSRARRLLSGCAYYMFFMAVALQAALPRFAPGVHLTPSCLSESSGWQRQISVLAWPILVMSSLPIFWNIFGLLVWPAVLRRETPIASELQKRWNIDIVISFRYCTRGTNPSLVHKNVRQMYQVLSVSGLSEKCWRLEVVTDNPLHLAELGMSNVHVIETVVPSSYKCPRGGKYKARALHYAALNSELRLRQTDWIVHLDEETYFDVHTVCAIYEHCQKQNRLVETGHKILPDMGQGAILYNTFGLQPETLVTALADVCRVGDDFGKFHSQYVGFHQAAIGMHGSFAVVNQALEEQVGFDLGEAGSITEDSYFALKAASEYSVGVRWIDAFMYEQSPFTAMDFIRQRGRWFHGLMHCTLFGDNSFPWRVSLVMTLTVMVWATAFMVLPLRLLVNMSCAPDVGLVRLIDINSHAIVTNYMLGFVMSFSPYLEGWPRWTLLLCMNTSVLLWVISFMEIGGVMYGLFLVMARESAFYVVQKEKTAIKSVLQW